ncbi:aminotransferase class III-fold pyridoxal phosphate-dependent enzyme [Mangrovicoccus algicola]|uniref:Aminotransferase class III-fold pyridoxal phosphate-dependent enzyme n=1 Tax=Mangrovicoccus algicola TaxID=2771008 RepID=A0A8J6YVF8_9RHOB|nr:aminotransferase class III-fold pyridoxal phosphate-dependent enzyme [Mangrovicoccus algicola]MBE3636803.1 aminotransferase class III-fold pyridoxal phosphate-dependent enzyme [Mangrovicoccus algicola]
MPWTGPGIDDALAFAIGAYRERTPQSLAALEAARAVMPGGNTRSSLWTAPYPLSIASGAGCRIVDVDGNGYVDFLGEFTAGIFGHTEPLLARAIAEAHADGIGLSSHTPYETRLARRLVSRFPSMDLVRFANSGTEANLMALTAARRVTGRSRIVVFSGGYHGGVLSFAAGHAPVNVPFDFAVLPFDDARAAEAEFAARGSEIAAVLVEPMQGAGGCNTASPAFLAALRELCDMHGAVLIFDEVQTARMSLGGAQARLGLSPDMTVLGKIFGGGLAFGAFGGRRDIMEQFDPARPGALPHAGTFNNNRLAMAAGVTACDALLTREALDALYLQGEAFRADLNACFEARGGLFRVTGMGSIMNIHATGPQEEARLRLRLLHLRMMERGQYFAARGLIALSFPVGVAETDGFLAAVEDCMPLVAA